MNSSRPIRAHVYLPNNDEPPVSGNKRIMQMSRRFHRVAFRLISVPSYAIRRPSVLFRTSDESVHSVSFNINIIIVAGPFFSPSRWNACFGCRCVPVLTLGLFLIQVSLIYISCSWCPFMISLPSRAGCVCLFSVSLRSLSAPLPLFVLCQFLMITFFPSIAVRSLPVSASILSEDSSPACSIGFFWSLPSSNVRLCRCTIVVQKSPRFLDVDVLWVVSYVRFKIIVSAASRGL